MQPTKNTVNNVDPEIQERISNLVSAVGGFDPLTKEYKLGDEALACLRDIRKWIQLYDVKYDTLEVSVAIANSTLVTADLVEIINLWNLKHSEEDNKYMDRVVLACIELLVPLTWPLKIQGKEATSRYFSFSMYIKSAQAKYKAAIISHRGKILKTVLKIAAKNGLGVPFRSREPRDDGILSMVCSLFRNLLLIDMNDEMDRSNTLKQFSRQKVLDFFLHLGAGVGSHFDEQDITLLESLYFLVRGVDTKLLYELPSDTQTAKFDTDLRSMLDKEEQLSKQVFKPTRHSRFGTMTALKQGKGKYVNISGQKGLTNLESTLNKLDETKKWRKPRTKAGKDEQESTSYFAQTAASIHKDHEALRILREFTNEFLDSSYNPLFSTVRRLIERSNPRVSDLQSLVCFAYTSGWFVECQVLRFKGDGKLDPRYETIGTSLCTSAVATQMTMLRKGVEPGDSRSSDLVHACAVSLKQVLETIREMSSAKTETYVVIADGMKARIFYEESWLQLLASLPKLTKTKSLNYACDIIDLTHVLLKTLDEYARQHESLSVRSKSRARQRSKHRNVDEDEEDEGLRRITSERKFNLEKFVVKFVNEAVIESYERVLSNYRELSDSFIQKIFSFLRRTFGKTSAKALFYRISFMKLLLEMVSSQGLARDSKARKDADEFLTYFVYQFIKMNRKMPSIHLQLCGNMSPQDAFYYDNNGIDKVKYKPPKYEYSFKESAVASMNEEQLFSVLVSNLVEVNKLDFVEFVLNYFEEYIIASNGKFTTQPLTTDKDFIRDIHKDPVSRLFLRELGCLVNTAAGLITVPSDINEMRLIDRVEWIKKYKSEGADFGEGKRSSDFLKIANTVELEDDEPLQRPQTVESAGGMDDQAFRNNFREEYELAQQNNSANEYSSDDSEGDAGNDQESLPPNLGSERVNRRRQIDDDDD